MPRGPKGEKGPAEVIGNAVHASRIATGRLRKERPILVLHMAGSLGTIKKLSGK